MRNRIPVFLEQPGNVLVRCFSEGRSHDASEIVCMYSCVCFVTMTTQQPGLGACAPLLDRHHQLLNAFGGTHLVRALDAKISKTSIGT